MGSLYILSFLSFLTDFFGKKSKQCLFCNTNLSSKLFDKERKREKNLSEL